MRNALSAIDSLRTGADELTDSQRNLTLKLFAISQSLFAGARATRLRHALAVSFAMALFIASVVYIARSFQWHEVGKVFARVNLPWLILGGGLSTIAYWILRALRWHALLKRTGVSVRPGDLYVSTVVALSLAIFTPLQSGEALKIEFLRNRGVIRGIPGYATFLTERILDLATVFGMACWGVLIEFGILPSWLAYALFAAMVVGGGGIFVLRRLRLPGKMGELLDEVRRSLGDPTTFASVLVITVMSWAAVTLSWQIFLYSAGIELGFGKAVALVSLVTLASVISMIPGGLGVSDVSVFEMLRHFGFADSIAQDGTVVLRLYSVVVIVLAIAHLGLWNLIRAKPRAI